MRVLTLSFLCFLSAACSSRSAAKADVEKAALYESDDSNCGALGYACVDGRTCSDSVCTPAWIPMNTDGAPDARGAASAGFVDGKYVVYGGCDSVSGTPTSLSSGASYDLSGDTWGSVPDMSAGRSVFSLSSTDSGLYAFGGLPTCWDGTSNRADLEVLFDLGGQWSPMPAPGEPSPRYNQSMTWTGDSLIVFGGSDSSSPAIASGGLLSLGSSWETIDCGLSGCERGGQYASFFDKGVLHVWGGGPYGSAQGGLIYDLTNKTWYDWTVPDGTPDFVSEFNGQVRFGDDGRRIFYLSGGTVYIYDRKLGSWSTDSSTMPTGMSIDAAAVWAGSELVAWGGRTGSTLSAVGGRYQPPAPAD